MQGMGKIDVVGLYLCSLQPPGSSILGTSRTAYDPVTTCPTKFVAVNHQT